MNLGIGISLTNYRSVPTVALDPDAAIAALFESGEVGAWYDPSDSATVWQDAAGTTPATVGDPVGRIDDKSGNGNHATQTTSAARPVLQQSGATPVLGSEEVTNGTFDAGLTGWTSGGFDPATLDSGGAKIERDAVTNSALVQANVFVVGKTYRISYDVLSGSGNTGASLFIVGQNADSVPGSYSFVHTATTTTFEARCYLNNYATIDNISVQEVTAWTGGLRYLDFDGVDDSLVATYGSTFTDITRSVAYRAEAVGDFVVDDADNTNAASLYVVSDGNLRWAINGAAGANSLFAATDWNINTNEVAVAVALADASMSLSGSGISATGTAPSSPANINGVRLGAASSGVVPLDGRIYGFIDIDRGLSAGETDSVKSYLATKSGVTL